jgi:MFS transporter, DHA3 family, tetracycline resistance protein
VLSNVLARRQRHDPVPVYMVLMLGRAISHSLFFTVQLIYQVTVVGLNPFQMVLVGTVLEVCWVLFEIPTGVVADVFSRRLSVLIGFALIGCAYALEGGIPVFWAALLGQVFWAVGGTFASGATEAWITDEVGEESVGPIFLRGRQMWLIGLLIGTVACVGLGLVHIQLPMILAGVGMAGLSVAMILVMPERHMHAMPDAARSTFGHMKQTAESGFRLAMARPVVKVIIGISLIVGLAAEAWDRLYIPSVIDRFDFPTVFGRNDPLVWFGISGVIGTVLGLAGAEFIKRKHPEALGVGAPAQLLAGCSTLQVVALVVFAVSGNLWLTFAMIWVRTVANSVSEPVEAAWLNRNLDPSTRATVNSMTGQANSLGQVGGGLALGWVGNAASIQAALLGSAMVLSPTVALYRRLIVRPSVATEPAPSLAIEDGL